jgi:mannose-6-phosphate isomerase-like protein (cupin superfamily)
LIRGFRENRILGAGWQDQGMRFLDASKFTAKRPWDALAIAEIDEATVRPHWTDQPYVWHVNDGPEVFVVLDGAVDMHYRHDGEERVERLTPGRVCYAEIGDEHVAHPVPEARIVVIERKAACSNSGRILTDIQAVEEDCGTAHAKPIRRMRVRDLPAGVFPGGSRGPLPSLEQSRPRTRHLARLPHLGPHHLTGLVPDVPPRHVVEVNVYWST